MLLFRNLMLAYKSGMDPELAKKLQGVADGSIRDTDLVAHNPR